MKKEEKENEESEFVEVEREVFLDGMGEIYDFDYDLNVLI